MDLQNACEVGFVQNNYRYKHYRGYQIIAAGEVCQIVHAETRIDRFAREYLGLNIPAAFVLAMLIDEAEERIDAILNTAECSSRLTRRRQGRDRSPDE